MFCFLPVLFDRSRVKVVLPVLVLAMSLLLGCATSANRSSVSGYDHIPFQGGIESEEAAVAEAVQLEMLAWRTANYAREHDAPIALVAASDLLEHSLLMSGGRPILLTGEQVQQIRDDADRVGVNSGAEDQDGHGVSPEENALGIVEVEKSGFRLTPGGFAPASPPSTPHPNLIPVPGNVLSPAEQLERDMQRQLEEANREFAVYGFGGKPAFESIDELARKANQERKEKARRLEAALPKLRQGMTPEQVQAILGPPNHQSIKGEYDPKGGRFLVRSWVYDGLMRNALDIRDDDSRWKPDFTAPGMPFNVGELQVDFVLDARDVYRLVEWRIR